MILKRLKLESFRCFAQPMTIAFDDRVTVVHGDNGMGKSTVFEALARTLFDRPDSQSAELDALKPWGAEVAPRVELDFVADGTLYRVEKSFGARGGTRLLRHDGRELAPWKEGSPAVEWLRALLGAHTPARGPSKPEQRGLGQVLLVPQGEPDLPEKLGDGALERLHALVDAVLADPVGRAIENEIKKRHDQLFTGGGQPKKGAPAQSLREERAQAETRLAEAQAECQKTEALRAELARASGEATQIAERRRTLAAERDRLAPLAREQRALEQKRDEARRALETAERAFTLLAERIQQVADLRQKSTALEALTATLTKAEAETARAAEEAVASAMASGQALAAAETRRDEARALRKTAEEARKLARATEELGELEPRLAALAGAQSEAEALATELAGARGSFSGQRIKALREALADEAQATARVDALKLRVTVRALAAVELDGEKLKKGEERVLGGEGRLTVRVGGAELEIAGPAVDHEAARAAQARARSAADAIAAELGSRDPSELEVWRHDYKVLQGRIEIARTRAESALRAGETAPELAARAESARRTREALLGERSQWRERAPEPGPLEAAAQKAQSEAEAALEARRREDDTRRRAADAALIAREQKGRELTQAREQRGQLADALTRAADDGLDDAAREAQRRARSAEKQAAADAHALAAEALARIASEGDPADRLDALTGELDRLFSAESRAHGEQTRADQALADAIARAPHAQLAEAEEKLAVISEALTRADREAEAIRLLARSFAEEHAATSARLVDPVQKSVLPRLRKLSGQRPAIETVTLDESLRPATVGVRGVEAPVAPSELSYGTRDQLALLVRLALGELAAPASDDGRLPAILDDPLVHADARRIKRFLTILDESARRLQLVILTCRPDDYRGLSGATFVDLGGSGDLFSRASLSLPNP